MDKIYHEALKLLRKRDFTSAQLRARLVEKFGNIPDGLIESLQGRKYLDDRRFAMNHVTRRSSEHPSRVMEELLHAGVGEEIAQEAVKNKEWPSLKDVVRAKMTDWRLAAPLNKREAGRLYRALGRLGYPEDEIREELEQFHEE